LIENCIHIPQRATGFIDLALSRSRFNTFVVKSFNALQKKKSVFENFEKRVTAEIGRKREVDEGGSCV
jgi:hypothetical protein